MEPTIELALESQWRLCGERLRGSIFISLYCSKLLVTVDTVGSILR